MGMPGEIQDIAQLKRSCWNSQGLSRRQEDFVLTVCGFTAGGSGWVSSDDITSNAPSTQTVNQIAFIPARAPIAHHNGLQRSWHYADRQLKRSS
jgi:hypothetical protein